jgi:chromosome segregation ATPase
MDLPKNIKAVHDLRTAYMKADVETKKLHNSLKKLTAEQQLQTITTKNLSNEQIKKVLALRGVSVAEQAVTVERINSIAKIKENINAIEMQISALERKKKQNASVVASIQKLNAARTQEVEKLRQVESEISGTLSQNSGKSSGVMWAMAAFMAVTSAINTYSRSREAKNAGEALGNSIGGALTSAMSGAMMGFQIGGGWGALIGGVAGLAISGISSALGYQAGETQRTINAMREITQEWQNQQRNIQSTKETIGSISGEYERLARGVSAQGRNISLSADEYTRYNQIVNQIADMFPEMVRGFTAEGNAIIAHRGNVEELTRAYDATRV